MVIGEKFAWGHLRKTGGDATLTMFQLFPELIDYADPRHREDKHLPFADRGVPVSNKLLVCNIRRLPSIILSWSHHVNHWGHKGHPIPMSSPHEMSESSNPDTWLSEMTDHGRFEIGWWLRWEHLAADFIEFISWFTDVSEDRKEQIREIGRINALHYDHVVEHWFSDEQIARLYENNPIWASAEQDAYMRRHAPDWPGLASPVDSAAS
jgi:hypothetical protein